MKFLRNDFSDHPVFTHIEVEREQEVNNDVGGRCYSVVAARGGG